MQTSPGIHSWEDIYFSIDYDGDLNRFRAYYVYDIVFFEDIPGEIDHAMSMCEKTPGLSLSMSRVNDHTGLLHWEYESFNFSIHTLFTATRKTIKTIKAWELGSSPLA